MRETAPGKLVVGRGIAGIEQMEQALSDVKYPSLIPDTLRYDTQRFASTAKFVIVSRKQWRKAKGGKLVIAYIRVSTDKQVEKHGPAVQLQKIIDACKQQYRRMQDPEDPDDRPWHETCGPAVWAYPLWTARVGAAGRPRWRGLAALACLGWVRPGRARPRGTTAR